MGSGFDDWVYWHFFTIAVNCNSSHIELLMSDVCLTNLYEESLTNLGLISTSTSRIHECTSFYNCHAAGIEITISNSSVLSRGCVYRSVA
jgi:hypothetical protein